MTNEAKKGLKIKLGLLNIRRAKQLIKFELIWKDKKREKGEKFLEAGDHPMLEYSIIVRLSYKRSKNEGKWMYMLFFANRFSIVYVLLKILRIETK